MNRSFDVSDNFLWLMKIDQLLPLGALMQDAHLIVIPIVDNSGELMEALELWAAVFICELFAKQRSGDVENDVLVTHFQNVFDRQLHFFTVHARVHDRLRWQS